jgi:hypothetical protein
LAEPGEYATMSDTSLSHHQRTITVQGSPQLLLVCRRYFIQTGVIESDFGAAERLLHACLGSVPIKFKGCLDVLIPGFQRIVSLPKFVFTPQVHPYEVDLAFSPTQQIFRVGDPIAIFPGHVPSHNLLSSPR